MNHHHLFSVIACKQFTNFYRHLTCLLHKYTDPLFSNLPPCRLQNQTQINFLWTSTFVNNILDEIPWDRGTFRLFAAVTCGCHGARPTNAISIEFEQNLEFWFKIYLIDHNEILHTSRQLHCRDVCKISLWSAKYILNQSTANFDRNSNSIEIALVGRAHGVFTHVTQWWSKCHPSVSNHMHDIITTDDTWKLQLNVNIRLRRNKKRTEHRVERALNQF